MQTEKPRRETEKLFLSVEKKNMLTWKQAIPLVVKGLVFVSLLYACFWVDWYNYEGPSLQSMAKTVKILSALSKNIQVQVRQV